MKNTVKINPVKSVELHQHFDRWYDILEQKKIGKIFFLPHTDRVRRMIDFNQFLSDKYDQKVKFVSFAELEILYTEEKLPGLTDFFRHSGSKYLIYNAELFLKNKAFLLERILLEQLELNFPLLLFFDCLPRDYQVVAEHHRFFFQREEYLIYPLYLRENVFQFIKYLELKFNIKVNQENCELIFQYCGGYLWLVKEVCKQIKNGSALKQVFQSPNFVEKAKDIWSSFSERSQQNLVNFIQNSEVRDNIKIFQDFLLVNAQLGKKNLPLFLLNIVQSDFSPLEIRQDRIIWQGQDVTSNFSNSETRLLIYMLEKLDVLLTKDELAKVYWGENWDESFSSWAFDQLMYRLRKKMKKINLDYKIFTKRGKGYVVRKK